MIKISAIIIFSTLLSGCDKEAESTVKAGSDFNVDKLFTVDGCSVYRFYDGGRNVYFTNCPGQTQYTQSCGKSCTRSVGVSGGLKE